MFGFFITMEEHHLSIYSTTTYEKRTLLAKYVYSYIVFVRFTYTSETKFVAASSE